MTNQSESDPICCPKFDPALWDDKIVMWENKKFIRDSVCTFFYMPINFGSVMKRFNKTLLKSGAVNPDYLCLSDHQSKWKMNLLLAVNMEIPGAENIKLSGNYFFKVYEGPFRETEKWCKDFEQTTKSGRINAGKFYMWYTTCPKCAKKYGKNYVVLLAQVE